MSTKFYRVWNDFKTNFAGMNITGLRHVVTPTVTYLYQARPTAPASHFNQFDPNIDNLYRIHQLEFGLENKLQTKRDGQIVDLLRVLVISNFEASRPLVSKGFNPFVAFTDFNPNSWLSFHNENEYDFHAGHLTVENFDGTIHGDNWSFGLGNLFTRNRAIRSPPN